MPTSFLPCNSASKASIRKPSYLAKIFHGDHDKRCRPDSNRRAQSRAFVCLTLFCFSLIAFVHWTPSAVSEVARGWSFQKRSELQDLPIESPIPKHFSALKGLGTVFRRGTMAMTQLVVAHFSENIRPEDFRSFLRTLHRSGVTARADVVFLFASSPLPTDITDVIREEDDYFQELLLGRISVGSSEHPNVSQVAPAELSSNSTISPFNFNAFKKAGLENDTSLQPLWGSRSGNLSLPVDPNEDSRVAWGSMVGFDVSELNPDDALQGFIDYPPLQLRRWACYQMLLGMVKHKFTHILLTDVGGVLVLRDPLAHSRRKAGLFLSLEDRTWGASMADELGVKGLDTADETKIRSPTENNDMDQIHLSFVDMEGINNTSTGGMRRQLTGGTDMHRRGGKRRKTRRATGVYEKVYGKQMWSSLEEVEKKKKLVNSGVIVGGMAQIRGLANTMVTEIVRVALERKNRDPFPDNVLLSYLLQKSTVLGKRVMEHLHLMENADSFVHSLMGSQQPDIFFKKGKQAYWMIHGSNKSKHWSNVASLVRKDICSSPAEAMVYRDCTNNF